MQLSSQRNWNYWYGLCNYTSGTAKGFSLIIFLKPSLLMSFLYSKLLIIWRLTSANVYNHWLNHSASRYFFKKQLHIQCHSRIWWGSRSLITKTLCNQWITSYFDYLSWSIYKLWFIRLLGWLQLAVQSFFPNRVIKTT